MYTGTMFFIVRALMSTLGEMGTHGRILIRPYLCFIYVIALLKANKSDVVDLIIQRRDYDI